MFSVIFCQLQTTVSIVECQIFQSTYFPNNIYTNLHLLVAIRYYYFLVQQKIISNSIPWLKTTQHGPGLYLKYRVKFEGKLIPIISLCCFLLYRVRTYLRMKTVPCDVRSPKLCQLSDRVHPKKVKKRENRIMAVTQNSTVGFAQNKDTVRF